MDTQDVIDDFAENVPSMSSIREKLSLASLRFKSGKQGPSLTKKLLVQDITVFSSSTESEEARKPIRRATPA